MGPARRRWLLGGAAGLVVVAALVAVLAAGDRPFQASPDARTDVVLDPEDAPPPADRRLPDVERRPDVSTRPVCADGTGDGCFAWIVGTPGDAMSGGLGDVVVLPERDAVRGIDPTDGTERWRTTMRGVVDGTSEVLVTDGAIVVLELVAEGRAVTVLDPADGSVRWRMNVRALDALGAAEVFDDTVVVAGSARPETLDAEERPEVGDLPDGAPGATVAAFDAATGTLRWSSESSVATVTALGPVLVEGGDLVGLDAGTGEERWREDLGDPAPEVDHLQPVGAVVHLWSAAGTAELRSAVDGRLLHRTDLDGPAGIWSPDDRHVVAVDDDRLLAFADGEPAWEVGLDAPCCAGIDRDGSRLLVRTLDGRVVTHAVADGAPGAVLRDTPSDVEGWFVGGMVASLDDGATRLHLAYDDRGLVEVPGFVFPFGVHGDLLVLRTEGWVFAIPRAPAP